MKLMWVLRSEIFGIQSSSQVLKVESKGACSMIFEVLGLQKDTKGKV